MPRRTQDLDLTQKLTQDLTKQTHECMICYDRVKVSHSIWSCDQCYAIFHLPCIQTWANKSLDSRIWRCPGCQFTRRALPTRYTCFCGKYVDPPVDRYLTPHSCGNPCRRSLHSSNFSGSAAESINVIEYKCPHKCTKLCHPGPCPPCHAAPRTQYNACFCGSKQFKWTCRELTKLTDLTELSCGKPCQKPLACGVHLCPLPCHFGSCPPCESVISQKCFCGNDERMLWCADTKKSSYFDTLFRPSFSCGKVCGKLFICHEEAHRCLEPCHDAKVDNHRICPYSPGKLTMCPCGKSSLLHLAELQNIKPREKCTDPILTCSQPCLKITHLACGHVFKCSKSCHEGPCMDDHLLCSEKVKQSCRCRGSERLVQCHERANIWICTKLCSVKLSCGRHTCSQNCCNDQDHICTSTCGKLLSCKSHQCDSPCHRGPCRPCDTYLELQISCTCGETTLGPPLRCGVTSVTCLQPCSRPLPCGHENRHVAPHTCHSDDVQCSPCTKLVSKQCLCGKHIISPVPCHLNSVQCNDLCGKLLTCGHNCSRGCHNGECQDGRTCTKVCGKDLKCGHTCRNPCHFPNECDEVCSVPMTASCRCGTVAFPNVPCSKVPRTLTGPMFLKCSDACARKARNRRLAEAFQKDIKDDEDMGVKNFLLPDAWIVKFAMKFPSVAKGLEDQIITFIKSSERTFYFPPMRIDQRRYICECVDQFYFGVVAEQIDPEPKRSVVLSKSPHHDPVVPTKRVIDYVSTMTNQATMLNLEKSSVALSQCPHHHRHLLSTKPSYLMNSVERAEEILSKDIETPNEIVQIVRSRYFRSLLPALPAVNGVCLTLQDISMTDEIPGIMSDLFLAACDDIQLTHACKCECKGCTLLRSHMATVRSTTRGSGKLSKKERDDGISYLTGASASIRNQDDRWVVTLASEGNGELSMDIVEWIVWTACGLLLSKLREKSVRLVEKSLSELKLEEDDTYHETKQVMMESVMDNVSVLPCWVGRDGKIEAVTPESIVAMLIQSESKVWKKKTAVKAYVDDDGFSKPRNNVFDLLQE